MTYRKQNYLKALKKQLEPNIFKHSLAVEACMGGIYDYLQTEGRVGSDEPARDVWTLAGLLHDIDFGGEFKEFHPKRALEALAKYELSIDNETHQIILSHAPKLTGVNPKTKAQWSIFCCDSLTGLITATALIYPSKKLAEVKVSSVIKRFLKEPKFAAGTRRNEVATCSNPNGLNIPLEKFIEICLASMQKISPDLEL